MSRLHTIEPSEATGRLAETFNSIKNAIGMVPNAYATLGSNSPELLAHLLQLNVLLQTKSTLSKKDLEAINLAVSESTGCDYCVSAHTLSSKALGYTLAQTRALRAGSYAEDNRIDALVKFAVHLVKSTGAFPASELEALRAVGLTDQQVVETVAAVDAILFTNMLNRVNDTTLDFPRAM